MAVINPSSLSAIMQNALSQTIAKQTRKGNISLVEELMGYRIASQEVSQMYGPMPSSDIQSIPTRKLAMPEVLTGLVKSTIA